MCWFSIPGAGRWPVFSTWRQPLASSWGSLRLTSWDSGWISMIWWRISGGICWNAMDSNHWVTNSSAMCAMRGCNSFGVFSEKMIIWQAPMASSCWKCQWLQEDHQHLEIIYVFTFQAHMCCEIPQNTPLHCPCHPHTTCWERDSHLASLGPLQNQPSLLDSTTISVG